MKITELSLGSDITKSAGLLPVFMKGIDNTVLLAQIKRDRHLKNTFCQVIFGFQGASSQRKCGL